MHTFFYYCVIGMSYMKMPHRDKNLGRKKKHTSAIPAYNMLKLSIYEQILSFEIAV